MSTMASPMYSTIFLVALCISSIAGSADAQTPDPTTTTQPPTSVTPPNCREVDRGHYPAKHCNQYYECLRHDFILFPSRYKRVLRTCHHNQTFDASSGRCTEGTCSPKSVAPVCVCTGKYPAENCREYYECKAFLWPPAPLLLSPSFRWNLLLHWDYELLLRTCQPDEVFDGHKRRCVQGSC
ncbi:unnamed protein product [Acanthoscelides obtectus]|uniref:Chitin-binding type-2 domain-containing protein n=1 Tax=Acanthoscelides obtectus TaxID=200917 RepID=A0A9P0KZF7_ACAOB|nr:unnamed protein product [Acanthoscelides obtectus]CAK1619828.1 hypothetical protein AOBTE_LOCUS13 [Acanthoscelides obtectus]